MSSVTQQPLEERTSSGVRDRADVRRQIRLVITFGIMTLLGVVFFLTIDDWRVTYLLGERRSADNLPKDLAVGGTDLGPWIVGGLIVVAGLALIAALLNKYPKGWVAIAGYVLAGLLFYLAFIVWAYADQSGDFQIAISNPVPGTVRIATPIVLGALAGCLCERAGVINIAIEGQFLMGAFFASVFASFAAVQLGGIPLSLVPTFGLLGGALAGMLVASLLAFFAIRYQVNHIVLGVVIIALASGLTGFLLGQIPDGSERTFNNPLRLEQIRIPGLADIPIIGEALFNQTILVYIMYAAVGVVTYMIFQTRWGLQVRSVGEHPHAADTVGVKVNRKKWQAVLAGGVLAGLGGAFYTVGSTGAFDKDASAGTGFIALAAMIMGRWHPIGVTTAAVFFGFMRNLEAQLGLVDRIPGDLIGAIPYLATIIAVASLAGRVGPPAANGQAFVKE